MHLSVVVKMIVGTSSNEEKLRHSWKATIRVLDLHDLAFERTMEMVKAQNASPLLHAFESIAYPARPYWPVNASIKGLVSNESGYH